MTKVKAVVFDLDGVLVDACEIHYESLNKALKEICNYEISRQDHETIFNGLPTKVKLADLAKNFIIDKNSLTEVVKRKQELTIEEINLQVKFDPSKVDMMKHLKSAGIKIGCYTNAVRESAELMLKLCGVREYIMVLLTNEDVKICKPDPYGYALMFKKLNVLPEETAIVEDSPKGIEAASRSGAKVIEVASAKYVNWSLLKCLT